MVSAMLNEMKYDTKLGLNATFYNADFAKLSNYILKATEEFKSRANQPGQFLNFFAPSKNYQVKK